MMKVENLKTQEGRRLVITSKDNCRTVIHFDKKGNQRHTFVDRGWNKNKTKVYTWTEGGTKWRKVTIFGESKLEDKRVMFVD